MSLQDIFELNYAWWREGRDNTEAFDFFEECTAQGTPEHTKIISDYAEFAMSKRKESPYYIGIAAAGPVEDYVNQLVKEGNVVEMKRLYMSLAIRWMALEHCIWGKIDAFMNVVQENDPRH